MTRCCALIRGKSILCSELYSTQLRIRNILNSSNNNIMHSIYVCFQLADMSSSWFPLGAFPNSANFTENGNVYSDSIWSFLGSSSHLTTDAERDRYLFSLLCSSARPEIYIQFDMFRKFPAHLKVAAAYELRQTIRSLPKIESSLAVKSEATSLEYRNAGNTYFRNGEFANALELYCKSIATAPKNSPELAIAFGNRSAVLFKLKKYRLSLLDINRALQGNYPDSMKSKLIKRKQECVSIITESADVRVRRSVVGIFVLKLL